MSNIDKGTIKLSGDGYTMINTKEWKNILADRERLIKENERILELCIYALLPKNIYNHELPEDTKQSFKNIIKNNLNSAIYEAYKDSTPNSKIREKEKSLLKKLNEPNNDRWEEDDEKYYNEIKVQLRVCKELLEDK